MGKFIDKNHPLLVNKRIRFPLPIGLYFIKKHRTNKTIHRCGNIEIVSGLPYCLVGYLIN